MRCLNPYRMKNPRYPEESPIEFIDCGCGKCYPCLVNRRKSWLFRLSYESLHSLNVYFLTLTYDDLHCDGVLHRDHLQKFFKNLRRFADFKYYAIGEYGTHTLRPHYHAIIFFKGYHFLPETKLQPNEEFQRFVDQYWQFGFNKFVPATPATLNYVLHYHVRPKEPVKGKKNFFACSKRLGLQFLFNEDGSPKTSFLNLVSKSRFRIASDAFGNSFVIPRYYIKKLEESGYYVLPPVSSIELRPFPDAIYSILPDLKTFSDGQSANYSDSYIVQLMHDVLSDSDRKLRKYDYQTKTSL